MTSLFVAGASIDFLWQSLTLLNSYTLVTGTGLPTAAQYRNRAGSVLYRGRIAPPAGASLGQSFAQAPVNARAVYDQYFDVPALSTLAAPLGMRIKVGTDGLLSINSMLNGAALTNLGSFDISSVIYLLD